MSQRGCTPTLILKLISSIILSSLDIKNNVTGGCTQVVYTPCDIKCNIILSFPDILEVISSSNLWILKTVPQGGLYNFCDIESNIIRYLPGY